MPEGTGFEKGSGTAVLIGGVQYTPTQGTEKGNEAEPCAICGEPRTQTPCEHCGME